MEISNGPVRYKIGNKVADNAAYRLYLCGIPTEKGEERQGLLQVAVDTEYNSQLDRAAYVLQELKQAAQRAEDEYAKVKDDPDKWLNYELGFPELVDSFISSEQGGRRVNILAFRHVDSVQSLIPLSNLASKDRLRIDLKTSIWILGKVLKLLVLVHNEGIAARLLTGSNILVEPDAHYPIVFDWSMASIDDQGVISPGEARQDIASVAQAVLAALGGDLKKGIPDTDDENRAYADYILQLAEGRVGNAATAHRDLYAVVDTIWERKYHPFTTKPML